MKNNNHPPPEQRDMGPRFRTRRRKRAPSRTERREQIARGLMRAMAAGGGGTFPSWPWRGPQGSPLVSCTIISRASRKFCFSPSTSWAECRALVAGRPARSADSIHDFIAVCLDLAVSSNPSWGACWVTACGEALREGEVVCAVDRTLARWASSLPRPSMQSRQIPRHRRKTFPVRHRSIKEWRAQFYLPFRATSLQPQFWIPSRRAT